MSFRREKYVPRGGPDGGDGGDGGSVVVRAETGVDSFAPLVHRKHWRAQRGAHGQGSNRHGKSGGDLLVRVPPGTIVRDRDRGNVLRDLTVAGDEVVVARGGRGGRGNKSFATATNRAPRECEPGGSGEERRLALELKLIADVGLVGKPNAGKSTMLSRLSRAHPEIADYPFTTKHPNLGMVQAGPDHRYVLADIPGLIEGAHAGAGLGHEFLRHVERTRVLVHLVEPDPLDGSDPVKNYSAIRREIELHDFTLAQRPEILTVTKADLPQAEELRTRMQKELGKRVLVVSAVTGRGLAELNRQVLALLERLARESEEVSEPASAAASEMTDD